MTLAAVPSTLVKCLYLFFDLPKLQSDEQKSDDNDGGEDEFSARERRRLLQKMFIQVWSGTKNKKGYGDRLWKHWRSIQKFYVCNKSDTFFSKMNVYNIESLSPVKYKRAFSGFIAIVRIRPGCGRVGQEGWLDPSLFCCHVYVSGIQLDVEENLCRHPPHHFQTQPQPICHHIPTQWVNASDRPIIMFTMWETWETILVPLDVLQTKVASHCASPTCPKVMTWRRWKLSKCLSRSSASSKTPRKTLRLY